MNGSTWTAPRIREALAEVTVRASSRGRGGTLSLDDARRVVDALVASDDAPEWQRHPRGRRRIARARPDPRPHHPPEGGPPMTNRSRSAAPLVSDDEVRAAVREAARIVSEYQTGSSVGEVADCAHDLLAETLVLFDPEDSAEAEALIVRATFAAAGLDRASSDSSSIDQTTLVRMATPPAPGSGARARARRRARRRPVVHRGGPRLRGGRAAGPRPRARRPRDARRRRGGRGRSVLLVRPHALAPRRRRLPRVRARLRRRRRGGPGSPVPRPGRRLPRERRRRTARGPVRLRPASASAATTVPTRALTRSPLDGACSSGRAADPRAATRSRGRSSRRSSRTGSAARSVDADHPRRGRVAPLPDERGRDARPRRTSPTSRSDGRTR